MKLPVLIGCLGLGACAAPITPELSEMDPNEAPAGSETAVIILGRHFFLGVDERFDAAAQPLDRAFSARLGNTALASVAWIDLEHLSAVVPAELPRGTHDLVVVSPAGCEAVLAHAFEADGDDEDEPEPPEPPEQSEPSQPQDFEAHQDPRAPHALPGWIASQRLPKAASAQ